MLSHGARHCSVTSGSALTRWGVVALLLSLPSRQYCPARFISRLFHPRVPLRLPVSMPSPPCTNPVFTTLHRHSEIHALSISSFYMYKLLRSTVVSQHHLLLLHPSRHHLNVTTMSRCYQYLIQTSGRARKGLLYIEHLLHVNDVFLAGWLLCVLGSVNCSVANANGHW